VYDHCQRMPLANHPVFEQPRYSVAGPDEGVRVTRVAWVDAAHREATGKWSTSVGMSKRPIIPANKKVLTRGLEMS
jgi:hypothetical protein